MDDPFACFGNNDDDDSDTDREDGTFDDNHSDIAQIKEMVIDDVSNSQSRIPPKAREGKGGHRRDEESCGVLSYHHQTEQSLLMQVEHTLSSLPPHTYSGTRTKTLLAAVDKYCEDRHWMMHVGPEKGSIVAMSLQTAVDGFVRSPTGNAGSQNIEHGSVRRRPFVCVELGSYCGYASIFMGDVLRSNQPQRQRMSTSSNNGNDNDSNIIIQPEDGFDFRFYTLEINPDFTKVARDMIRFADMDDLITVLQTHDGDDVGDILQRAMLHDQIDTVSHNYEGNPLPPDPPPKIDFLFIDHDKGRYLPDLRILERKGLLRAGSIVVADNVTFARIDDYVGYMERLKREGVVETEIREAAVEYCSLGNRLLDGVGETVWFMFAKFLSFSLMLYVCCYIIYN